MAGFRLPSDPEALLNFMDDIDTDASDSDFDGYIDSEYATIEREQRRRERVEAEAVNDVEWCAGDKGENGDGFSGASTESGNAEGDDENAGLNGETAGSGEGNGCSEGECESSNRNRR